MYEFQFLNFGPEEKLDKPVYRIMKRQHVISLFQGRQNAMSQFGNWKDKFENFLMNCGHELNGIRYENTCRDKMVAQCWTTEAYAEAMWGIYANDPKARFLRVRSTPRKLLNGLNCARPTEANALNRIGKVKYKTTREIKKYYEGNKSERVTQPLLFQSLLIKRRAFAHEREVRLIRSALFETLDDRGLYWYDVDPHQMITQIMADPNCSRVNWSAERARIQSETGFLGEIKRSKIYDAPNW